MNEIKLIDDTIDSTDISRLVEWLETNPRLTKGELTTQFEQEWSKWLGRKYSVFVNSGSSANLAMVYALMQSGRLKNNKIILPTVSWATTITPAIHLGLEPILCECDSETLGVDLKHLEQLIDEHNPSILMIVHVLGFPCQMDRIRELCDIHDIILLEDSCESIGTTYKNVKTGCFGLMSTFSFYYGHHISTIEGGMISTDDEELYEILVSIRSHGWDRDLKPETQQILRNEHGIDDFRALFTFYYSGFNIRSTDLQAFIGQRSIQKIDEFAVKRQKNFLLYDELVVNPYWKIPKNDDVFCSNFAYPIITPNISGLVKNLRDNAIECRPLVCGSIGLQPFWIKKYGKTHFDFADKVHEYGLYLPNNHNITTEQIKLICDVVNNSTNPLFFG
jgi:CDP-6-deoxy-D-xylo-4-hexulose-3-dehydrase